MVSPSLGPLHLILPLPSLHEYLCSPSAIFSIVWVLFYLGLDFFSVDFIGGFDPFPLYHVTEKPSSLLFKQAYL